MRNKPSILIVSSWYPSKDNPTNGSFVHEQAKMLSNYGHNVTVIHVNLNGSFIDTLKGKRIKDTFFLYDEIPVYVVGVNVFLPKLKHFYYKLLTKKTLSCIKRNKIEFDIIHSHAILSGGVIASKMNEKLRKPLFHTEHSSGLIFKKEQYSNRDKIEIIQLVENAQKVFFVSNFALKNSFVYKDLNSNKLEVLHNIVANSFFLQPFSQRIKQILVIGDFIQRKNYPFIIDVWKNLRANHLEIIKDYQLKIVGNGFDCNAFKELVNGLEGVVINKRLNRTQIVEHIAQSSILLSASKLETFGLTIAESLALGVPVVVTNSGGPTDIVSSGDGFIVEKDNVAEFSHKIIEVINGKCDNSFVIRNRCRSKFSEEVIYEKLLGYYFEK